MFYFPTPALQDNVIWGLGAGDPAPGDAPVPVLVVDPGEADALHQTLLERHLALHAIVITHHHADHVDGIARLLELWPEARLCSAQPQRCRLGERGEGGETALAAQGRLIVPQPGQTLTGLLPGLHIEVLAVPGHTLDHLAYVVTEPGRGDAPLLLCGDTLFSAGCGRMFEGTPQQFSASLAQLAALPGDTRVLCAHEYTLSNLSFAQAVEPGNDDIDRHLAWARQQRDQGLYTLGTELRQEKRINPFLRLTEPAVVAAARREGASGEDAVAVFAALRAWKNRF